MTTSRYICAITAIIAVPIFAPAQTPIIKIHIDHSSYSADVTVDGKPFTSFLFFDTLEKPVLYPIYAPDGQLITRGFPLQPRPGDPTDHPHHIGLWFNYENVNGLDFWNNSYAIPAAKKSQYSWIRTDSVSISADNHSNINHPYSGTAVPSNKNTLVAAATTNANGERGILTVHAR